MFFEIFGFVDKIHFAWDKKGVPILRSHGQKSNLPLWRNKSGRTNKNNNHRILLSNASRKRQGIDNY